MIFMFKVRLKTKSSEIGLIANFFFSKPCIVVHLLRYECKRSNQTTHTFRDGAFRKKVPCIHELKRGLA